MPHQTIKQGKGGDYEVGVQSLNKWSGKALRKRWQSLSRGEHTEREPALWVSGVCSWYREQYVCFEEKQGVQCRKRAARVKIWSHAGLSSSWWDLRLWFWMCWGTTREGSVYRNDRISSKFEKDYSSHCSQNKLEGEKSKYRKASFLSLIKAISKQLSTKY